jgi:N4-(beta-N-acetylglucosaminyl)-L-asparaginase
MSKPFDRRGFLRAAGALGVGTLFSSRSEGAKPAQGQTPSRPVVISSRNGLPATEKAMKMIREGADPLDAVVSGVNLVEEDPTDHSVGYGGLPNESGVVQLDASVMHGPTNRGGAVAALRGIKTPSSVAKLVMERTDHVLLVDEGARRFAKAHGFKEEELLTDKARKIWLYWKESLSNRDDWLPPKDTELDEEVRKYFRIDGTINCNAVDAHGNIGGVTTTSGLAFKIPGRLAALKRVAEKTEPRHLDDKGRPTFGLSFYVINKRGDYAGVSMWGGAKYVVHDGTQNQKKESAYLYKKDSQK